MKVRCIKNNITEHSFSSEEKEVLANFISSQEDLFLALDKEYDVHAIVRIKGVIWIYIFEDSDSEYPIHYPIFFFELTSLDIPDSWKYTEVISKNFHEIAEGQVVSFVEWRTDKLFYERLIDGYERELQIMSSYKGS